MFAGWLCTFTPCSYLISRNSPSFLNITLPCHLLLCCRSKQRGCNPKCGRSAFTVETVLRQKSYLCYLLCYSSTERQRGWWCGSAVGGGEGAVFLLHICDVILPFLRAYMRIWGSLSSARSRCAPNIKRSVSFVFI